MKIIIPKMWAAVVILLSVYVSVLVVFYLTQDAFVFLPDKHIAAEPKHIKLAFEDIYFETSDKLNIHGWFVPSKNAEAVILFCHGNAGNISRRLDTIQMFNHFGFDVLIFDYRGYGKSQGKPSEQGIYQDAQGAWEYLTTEKGYKESQIVVFGRSLGGAVGVWLAEKNKPAALVVESSFTSIPDIGAEIYPFLPVNLISRNKFNSLERIGKIEAPVMIIHSKDDDLIPFKHGQKLYKAASDPKEFLEILGSHNEGFVISGKRYEDSMSGFIRKHIKN